VVACPFPHELVIVNPTITIRSTRGPPAVGGVTGNVEAMDIDLSS
jgi:hypothetical protein